MRFALVEVQRHPHTLEILALNLFDGLTWNSSQATQEVAPASGLGIPAIYADPEHRQPCLALGEPRLIGQPAALGLLPDLVRQLDTSTSLTIEQLQPVQGFASSMGLTAAMTH